MVVPPRMCHPESMKTAGELEKCSNSLPHLPFLEGSPFPRVIMADPLHGFIRMQGAPTGYVRRIQVSLCNQVSRGIQLHPVRQTKQGSP